MLRVILTQELTGNCDVSVGLPLLYYLEHLLGAAHEPLRGALDVDNLVLVFVNSQVDFGSWEMLLLGNKP